MKQLLALLVLLLAVAGCGGGGTEEPEAAPEPTAVETEVAEAEPTEAEPVETEPEPEPTEPEPEPEPTEPEEPEGEAGTRENPLAIGESGTVGDYEVTLDGFTANATDAVMGANEFNEPASSGNYAMATLTLTYQGETEGMPAFDVTPTITGSDATQYDTFNCSAVAPEPALNDAPTLENGGTASGNVCFDIPAEAVQGGILFVEDAMSFDTSGRVYWAYE